jgi:colicin import membrane protein
LWEFKRLSADEMYTIEIDQGPNPNGGMFGFGKNTRPKEIIQVGSFHQVLYKLNSLARAYKVQYGKPSSHYTGLLNLLKKNNKKTCNLEKKITDKQIEDMLKVITKDDLFEAARKIARLTQPSFFNQLESNMALYISRAVACIMVGFSVYMVARVDKGGAGKVAGENFRGFVDQVIKKSGAKNANQAAAAALQAPLVAAADNAPQPCVAPTVDQQRKVAEGLRDKMDTVHKAAEAAVQEVKVGNAAAVAVKNAGIAHRAANSARIAAINSAQPSKSLVNLAKNAANKAEAARKRANQLASGPLNRKLSNAEMKEINAARALANKAANNAKKAASNAAASKASAKSGGPPPPPPPQPPRMPPPPASAAPRKNNTEREANNPLIRAIKAQQKKMKGGKINAGSELVMTPEQKTKANANAKAKANANANAKAKANANWAAGAPARKAASEAKRKALNASLGITPNKRSGNSAIASMLAAGASKQRAATAGSNNNNSEN